MKRIISTSLSIFWRRLKYFNLAKIIGNNKYICIIYKMSVASAGLSNVYQPTPLSLRATEMEESSFKRADNNATASFPIPLNTSAYTYIYSPFIVPVGNSLITVYTNISFTNTASSSTHPVKDFVCIVASALGNTPTNIDGGLFNLLTSNQDNTAIPALEGIGLHDSNTCFYNNTTSQPKTLYLVFKWGTGWSGDVDFVAIQSNTSTRVLSI
jgi:hypothetical protein